MLKCLENLSTIDKIIWLLTTVLYPIGLVMSGSGYYSITMLILVSLIFGLSIISNEWKICYRISNFHIMGYFFVIFCFLSSLWAWNGLDSISIGTTILQFMIVMSVLYSHYKKFRNVGLLINSIMFGGFVLAIYSLVFFGSDINSRWRDGFTNVNTIGVTCAYSVVIALYYLCKTQIYSYLLIILPSFFVLAGTASKKALGIIMIGALILYFFENMKKGWFSIRNILSYIFCGLCLYTLISFLSEYELFETLIYRVDAMLDVLNGDSTDYESSTYLRLIMIKIGFEQFLRTPIFGIGINNPHILNSYYTMDAYLHNNYMELLVGGGIVGFFCYYQMYFWITRILFKYKEIKNEYNHIVYCLLILVLITDNAQVSYVGMRNYFYLMILFLHCENLIESSYLFKQGKLNN